MCSLASYGIKELNIVLPYFPTGTMERIVGEGELGTGYYLAHLLNSIPCGAYKNVLYVMDMHALCSRFFFHTNIRTVFITMMPKYLDIIKPIVGKVVAVEAVPVVNVFKCIVFPDYGAEKRNKELCNGRDAKFITCSKKRSGDDRTIEITGNIDELKNAIHAEHTIEFYIVDDLVQTGGTLGETAKKLVETLHLDFSSIDAIMTSTKSHIRAKCESKNINIDADSDINADKLIQKVIATQIEANNKILISKTQTEREQEKLEKDHLQKIATKALSTEIQTTSSPHSCEYITNILKSLHNKTITKNTLKDIDDKRKKEEDAFKDIITLITSYTGLSQRRQQQRRQQQQQQQYLSPKFIINYIVTHSILPKDDPVKNIIKNVLFFEGYGDMVQFNYITTDSRPHLTKILTSFKDLTNGKENIQVIPILDVLQSVLTDIDSPYIAPYIIPNAYPVP